MKEKTKYSISIYIYIFTYLCTYLFIITHFFIYYGFGGVLSTVSYVKEKFELHSTVTLIINILSMSLHPRAPRL